jgi:hypothetical protein
MPKMPFVKYLSVKTVIKFTNTRRVYLSTKRNVNLDVSTMYPMYPKMYPMYPNLRCPK